MKRLTAEQLKAGLSIVLAVTEAIREAGEIPAGTLYAVLLGQVDLQGFEKIVSIVTGSGLVEKRGDLLRWVGPDIGGRAEQPCETCGGSGADPGAIDPAGEVCPTCHGSGKEPVPETPRRPTAIAESRKEHAA